jgi:hypothetical protein
MKNLKLTLVIAMIFAIVGLALPRSDISSSDAEDFGGPLTYSERMSMEAYIACRKTIREHVQRLASPRQIAMECGLGIGRINSLFEQYANESPLQYVERLKADHTAEMLRQRNELRRGKQTKSSSDACVACR